MTLLVAATLQDINPPGLDASLREGTGVGAVLSRALFRAIPW